MSDREEGWKGERRVGNKRGIVGRGPVMKGMRQFIEKIKTETDTYHFRKIVLTDTNNEHTKEDEEKGEEIG